MDRTYIFGEPSGGAGSGNGLLASILPSLQNRGIDTGYLMGLMGGNGNGHLCRHISKAFGIDPYGEEAQYLSGYVGQKMFPVAKKFLCEHCRKGLEK